MCVDYQDGTIARVHAPESTHPFGRMELTHGIGFFIERILVRLAVVGDASREIATREMRMHDGRGVRYGIRLLLWLIGGGICREPSRRFLSAWRLPSSP